MGWFRNIFRKREVATFLTGVALGAAIASFAQKTPIETQDKKETTAISAEVQASDKLPPEKKKKLSKRIKRVRGKIAAKYKGKDTNELNQSLQNAAEQLEKRAEVENQTRLAFESLARTLYRATMQVRISDIMFEPQPFALVREDGTNLVIDQEQQKNIVKAAANLKNQGMIPSFIRIQLQRLLRS